MNQGSQVLIVLALASALVFERQASARAALAQIAAAAVSVAFVIVALVKLYSASYLPAGVFQANAWVFETGVIGLPAVALGLIGFRVRIPVVDLAFASAVCAMVGCAVAGQQMTGTLAWASGS